MIITLIDTKININNDDFYCYIAKDIQDKLERNKIIRRRSLAYKLSINNYQKQLICPLLQCPSGVNVALWPSIKLPNRKYPVYVYVYAAALYLSSKMNMRDAASMTRQKFGLESFSHSTLSRILKKLSMNTVKLLSVVRSDLSPPNPIVGRNHWSCTQLWGYKKLLSIIHPVLKNNGNEFCSTLNYIYFNKNNSFLI